MPLSDPLCALSLTALTLVHRIGHRPGPSLVRLHRDESASVGVLELHDPKRLNGLSEALYVDILDAAHAITRLGDFRAVVIQGSGPHFCSGGSLDLLNLAAVGSPFQVALDLNARTCLAVNELRKVQLPMACAVQGKVIGGGLAVAGVADYLVSDARATFWLRNLSLGMSVIGCLSLTLPSRVGLSRALGFYLSNELLTVDGAQHLGLVDEIIHNGTDATQCRALQVAHVLAQDNVQASIFLQARVDISPLYAAAEMGRAAASMASFPGDNPEAARALFAVGHSHAPSKTPKLINFDLGASHSLPKAEPVVRTVDVSAFVLESKAQPWLQDALLIFRATAGATDFYASSSSDMNASGPESSADIVASALALLERLRLLRLPSIVVCHGITCDEGIAVPCAGTLVLAHSDSTFAFPGSRHVALTSIISTVAHQRLSRRALKWLLCSGCMIDTVEALRVGLVDFVGSWKQLEIELTRAVDNFRTLKRWDEDKSSLRELVGGSLQAVEALLRPTRKPGGISTGMPVEMTANMQVQRKPPTQMCT